MAVNPKTTMDINQVLPPEIVDKILSYLSIEEKMESCESVCRQWQQAVHHSTRCLAFGEIMDVFHGFHEHSIHPNNCVYRAIDADDKAPVIISNYCRNLRMFQGLCMNSKIMHDIAGICKFLHCIDTDVFDLEILTILGRTFGKQLTCVTLRLMDGCDISPFLTKCSKLTSLAAVLAPEIMTLDPSHVIKLFDLTTPNPKPFLFAKSLRNLVVEGYVSEKTLKHLKMFTELEMCSLSLHSNISQCREWPSLMKHMYKLKGLHVRFCRDIVLILNCLPSSLEYLSLEIMGLEENRFRRFDVDENQQIDVSIYLPFLKSLDIRLMSTIDIEFYLNSFSGCAELESLSIYCDNGFDTDHLISKFLLFSSLKRLALGSIFVFPDTFKLELFTKLEQLTSLGRTRVPATHYNYIDLAARFQDHRINYIPCGQEFWIALKTIAMSRPSDIFTITGQTIDLLHLWDSSFPPNISLVLEKFVTLKLSNGFAKSYQWEKWVRQWDELCELYIELDDVDFELRCLPSRLLVLRIKCFHEEGSCQTSALTFYTRLQFLNSLSISQQYMSNSHLLATVKCIANCCPRLKQLYLQRGGPLDEGPADDYVFPIFQCKKLNQLTVCGGITFSKEFAKRVPHEVQVIIGSHDDIL